MLLIHTGQLSPRVTVTALPDDVLIEVFGFCVDVDEDVDEGCNGDGDRLRQDRWLTLVHVCRRWRYVVFASSRGLDLQLFCNPDKLVKASDIWPDLPIVIYAFNRARKLPGVASIIATLKQPNRVCKICIDGIPNSLLKRFAAMSPRFPVLTNLKLLSMSRNVPILPDSFLGGSAPHLQHLWLHGVPSPALPKLLLSATSLVKLRLWNLPPSGYISPEAIVNSLSALAKLKSLHLGFRSPRSQANQQGRPPPPMTRVVLPALTELWFTGDNEYLEDTLPRIDTPLLCDVLITFFNQLAFDTPSLRDFISRTESFKVPHQAHLFFSQFHVTVMLPHGDGVADLRILRLGILHHPSRSGCPTLVQMYNSCVPPFPTSEYLVINENEHSQPQWQDYLQSAQWLNLFRSFTSVKCLWQSKNFVRFVSSALGGLTGLQVTEVLPALQIIIVEGPQSSDPTGVHHGIMSFVAARDGYGSHVGVQFREP